MMKKICGTAVLAFVLIFTLQTFVQAQNNPIDFSGVWKDPYDITCWTYKFIVVEDDLVIRTSCAGGPEDIFGWAKLNARQFTGKMNTAPGASGGSRYSGKIEGRISDDNKIIYITWPYRDGPHSTRFIRE